MLCRQASEKSALELIHDRLLLEAKRNLVYTSMNISEVSYAVGFADPAYFTRFFKRLAGMSPKEFREHAESLHLNP
jgi:AraC family transcriptional regulator, transcriptional activator of pobA